jgi:hypothetical protein
VELLVERAGEEDGDSDYRFTLLPGQSSSDVLHNLGYHDV